ncbi:hypothetical protein C488_09047 [Natrinema pellirubrum DSM 15624]|uniref:Uncharacterized protein n=1 Tax=Natrinema pellirubrum (strain DSM 15624 / CIP 106293 / JCM 10476 / NCIMB 786 / 157) TaxID=797303 RepID=L0JQA0_NATP1|nr:hypothetical protein [Natrinema pellirubrum]AGB32782.1 hypothetical protein Natpe_2987 [Natrinema pellirubrum DSM 15624]ELY75785.1 hypothetical protein C488_09047 [Natrinema pellirubrum DSM 15624]
MAIDELLEGADLTGRQAAIIFFSFLLLIVLAAVLLITFSDFFRNLVVSVQVAVVVPAARPTRAAVSERVE